jgi:hypothetical protein
MQVKLYLALSKNTLKVNCQEAKWKINLLPNGKGNSPNGSGWEEQFNVFFAGNQSTSLFLQTMHSIPFLAKSVIASTHGKPF